MQDCGQLLAVDIGNSNIVLGVIHGGRLRARWRISTHSARTIDESWVILSTLLASAGLAPDQLAGVAIASVVPDLDFVWLKLSEHYLRLEPFLLTPDSPGLPPIELLDPAAVGADRLCNAAAAFELTGGAAIVVDFGTATTFDIVGVDGAFRGGLILPGPQTALRNLHQSAAKLPKVALAFPPKVIGTSTETAMQSGLLWGTVAQVEGLIVRIRAELAAEGQPGPVPVYATGGFGRLLCRHLPSVEAHLPYLVLYGLGLLYGRARGCRLRLELAEIAGLGFEGDA
jgi:type III pantothenate kinase